MFRKLILSTAVALATLTGLALTPTTSTAHPPIETRPIAHNHVKYEVLYRHRNHWDVMGTYCDRDEARQVARSLRHRGYNVQIRRV